MGITRRIVLIGTVMVLLTAAPVAGASAPERLSAPANGPAAGLRAAAAPAESGFAPLAARLLAAAPAAAGARGGTATLTGTVSTFRGPLNAARVSWSVPGAAGGSGQGTTSEGLYSFSSVPAASGNGSLVLDLTGRSDVTDQVHYRLNASWPEGSTSVFDFFSRPVPAVITSGGPWPNWTAGTVWMSGSDGGGDLLCAATLRRDSGTSVAAGLPGIYDTQEVYWYTNQGQEYHERIVLSPVRSTIADVEFVDDDTGWLLAAEEAEGAGARQHVYRTTDGGHSWTPSALGAGGSLQALDFCDPLHGWAVGFGGRIVATQDGGITWSEQSSGVTGQLRAVAAIDAEHACAVGEYEALVSTSDGSTWQVRTPPVSGSLTDVRFTDAAHGFACSAGGLLFSGDAGATWQVRSSDPATVTRVGTYDAVHLAGASPGNGPRYSIDGGVTWTAAAPAVADSVKAIEMGSATAGWMLTIEGAIWKTNDGGQTWTIQRTANGFSGSGLWGIAAPSAQHAWAAGTVGQLIECVDGATWSATTLEADQASAPRISVRSPLGASGRPGSQVKVTLSKLTAGYQAQLTGRSDYPVKPARTIREHTSRSSADETVTLTVPSNATPGYFYWLGLRNKSGALWLEAPFQVSTLKASRGAVRAGSRVTFSGVVPTKGHIGSKPGVKKRLHLWMSTKSPTRGYQRVDVSMCKGNGSYAFEKVRPKRTAWWIVVYNGDAWYWQDATSPVKVTVR